MMQEFELEHMKTRGWGWRRGLGAGRDTQLSVRQLEQHWKAAFLTAPDTVPADWLFFTALDVGLVRFTHGGTS